MNFEHLQQTWQSQHSDARLSVDINLLLNEMKRNQQQLSGRLLMRDLRDVGAAVVLAVWSTWVAIHSRDWSHFLMTGLAVYVGAFMLIYRRRHPEKTPDADSPLRFHVQAALQQVTDQIWLLKNVGWWGLWPMFAVSAVLVGRIGWKDWRRGDHSALIVLPVLLVFGAACWAVHWLNQNAIRKEFEPRRRELETLLSSFEVEPPEISPPPSP